MHPLSDLGRPGRPAGQSAVRRANLSLVLRAVCAAPTPVSRAEVAAVTGLTRATTSVLVDLLVADGLVDELDRRAGVRGRPATPLAPGRGAVALGLQVDTGLLAGRVLDLRGDVVAEEVLAVDVAGRPAGVALRQLAALARRLLSALPPALRVLAAGLALPGIVDRERAVLLRAPNLGWVDVRPARALAAVLLPSGVGLRVGNEADLAAHVLAAPRPGRRGPHDDFLYVSGNVGIGAASVVDGHVMTGSRGHAGEVGHVCVDPCGPRCACGSSGCLEQYAGRRALLVDAGLAADGALARLRERAEQGDPRAVAAVDRAVDALGIALAGALNLLDLPTVVLGGDLAELASLVAAPLESRLRERVLAAAWAPPVVATAHLGPAPAATGAALTCLEAVLSDVVPSLTPALGAEQPA